MKLFAINYTLPLPGQDYAKIRDGIYWVSFEYAHISDSMWLIKSQSDVVSIRNALKAFVDGNDFLFVAEVVDWASLNLSPDVVVWADGYFPLAA